MTKTLLSIGHGYSAQALSKLLLTQGWRIIGTTRSAQKAQALRQSGITALIWPGDDLTPALTAATHLLISAAPTEKGDPFLQQCVSLPHHLEWVGYLSTTGVYGDHKGDWVDENTPLTPTTARGKLRVRAERAWQQTGLPLHIFRLAGIYGPGRGPFSKVRNGTARRIIKKGQVFSRIHVEDIAQVVAASICAPHSGAIYNLCDDYPAPPQDVIAFAAQLLGRPIPKDEPWQSAQMSQMARSFYAESKRVRNERIKTELGVVLKYPDYKTGLRALLNQQKDHK